MALKQSPGSIQAPDGSQYVVLTDGAGNLAPASGGGGSTQVVGDSASGAADSGSNPVKVGGRYNTTPPTFTNGQRGDLQVGTRGALEVQLMVPDAGPVNTAAGGSDGQSTTNVGYTSVPYNLVFNGTTWDRMRGSTAGLTVLGPFNDGIAVTGQAIPNVVEGRTTNKTAVTTGQYVRPIATTIGVAVQKPYQVPELDWTFAAASGGIVNTADNVLIAAAGAGIKNYLTGVSITNASATIATEVVIKDGAAVIWRGYVGAGTLLNSSVGITFPTPLRSTANTALNVACITTAAQVYVNAQGYQAP